MQRGDQEAPQLYKSSVLNTAKHELLASMHLDPDPVIALSIMQIGSLKHIIHLVSLIPFTVHYWSNHQLHVYKTYCSSEPACIAIDATGSIVKKIERLDSTKSKHIFLYTCVVNFSNGQFSVAQMLTENHTTNSVQYWLMEWVRTGALHPKEIVCDSSRALLTAAIRVFTSSSTIDEYADACFDTVTLPKCFVRIDVAHFIKSYATLLKGMQQRIRKFYLASLGQLIIARDIKSAAAILRSIFTISRSETDGELKSGELTSCEAEKNKMKNLFMDRELHFIDIESAEVEDVVDFSEEPTVIEKNRWVSWAKSIDFSVKATLESEVGMHDNAHWMPMMTDRLIRDIKWFPLWGNVRRNDFGYGRVPASSASVESEFNNIKSRLLKHCSTPMRVDDFVEKHMQYINGHTKIIDAAILKSQETAPAKLDTSESAHNQMSERMPESTDFTQQSEHMYQQAFKPSKPNTEEVSECSNEECLACRNGDVPTGIHKYIF